jgi:hypothetical protein
LLSSSANADGRGQFRPVSDLRTGDTPRVNIHFGGLSGHDRFSELGDRRSVRRSSPIRQRDLIWV